MIKIWYHRNCFDGFGAALAAWLKYGDTAEYYPVQYQSEYPTLEPGDELYIVDHSVKENHMNELLSISDNITVLDHHKTAEEELSPFLASGQVKGLFDMDKSGAVLSWEFFQPGKPLPKLFHAIQDRDLWHFKCEGTNEVNMALQLLPLDFAKWQKFLDDEHFLTLIPRGKDLLKYHNRQVKQSKRNAFLCELLGHEVPVVNLSTSSMISDVVGQLSDGYPFAACFFQVDNGWVYSLRSSNGFDVSELAKSMGGGGHQAASGLKSDQIIHKIIRKLDVKK